ncbi:MAG: tRNA-dihydrouridine synthase family protein [Lentisphaerae bacterium]|nr:tRNA-dihydrouridine synthase family protein [Lentisphaerota bacterium]
MTAAFSGDTLYEPGQPLLAPIAGHTDLPMRLSARRYGCRYAFTEMVDAGSLVFGNFKTCRQLIARDGSEDFLGIQLVGSEPDILVKAAAIVNSLDFSVLDFNLGCPAPKVAKKCEGISFVIHRPDEALRAFAVLAEHSRIPVTAKTRILSEEDPEPTVRFARRLQEAGARALTIHGRVMKKFYSGPVFYDIIKAVRENLTIPVIANGGALSQPLYHELVTRSSCANGMVARGACGNPWIFREITAGHPDPPTLQEFAAEIRLHFESMMRFYGLETGFRICRKTLLAYLLGRGFPGELRASVSTLDSLDAFETMMRRIEAGPAERYWQMLAQDPAMERRLKPAPA